jgi:ornithine cyclodeaminase/alanine dehydrogenase-like protein (mu-crystallin family)
MVDRRGLETVTPDSASSDRYRLADATSETMMHLVDAAEVTRRLSMPAAIAAARTTFHAIFEGRVTAPPRAFYPMDALGDGAILATMPAHVSGPGGALSTKVVSIVPGNAARDLPTIHGLIAVFDPETGVPLGVVDGTTVTAIRTAAVSGLATELLAAEDASTVCILGTGVQGRQHVAAVRAVRPITHVRLWNRTPDRADVFASELRQEGLTVDVLATPAAAARGADIVCACTAATQPLLTANDVDPGAHVNAVGAFTPSMRELSASLVASAWLAVDTREGAWEEAGDLLLAVAEGAIDRAHVQADLGELVAGAVIAPRNQTTLFKSVGHAAEDAVTAASLLT